MKKLVSMAVAASVIALSASAFAANTPAPSAQPQQGKVIAVKEKDCSKIKDEKKKAKCEAKKAKAQH